MWQSQYKDWLTQSSDLLTLSLSVPSNRCKHIINSRPTKYRRCELRPEKWTKAWVISRVSNYRKSINLPVNRKCKRTLQATRCGHSLPKPSGGEMRRSNVTTSRCLILPLHQQKTTNSTIYRTAIRLHKLQRKTYNELWSNCCSARNTDSDNLVVTGQTGIWYNWLNLL